MQNLLVVKLGGGEGLDIAQACADLAHIARTRPVVILHGVSAKMAQLSYERGIEEQMLTSPGGHSSRYTTPQVRDLFVEAAGYVNAEVRRHLDAHGISTTGLTEDVVIRGERKRAIRAVVNGRTCVVRDDYSGSISGVNVNPIFDALESGRVPVLPPLAFDLEDGLLNIDGDRAAAAVAAALHADTLVILSNVRGLYRNYPDESSFVHSVDRYQIDAAMNWAQGRMKRKVLGAQEAVSGGVNRVIIGDGRGANPVTNALDGIGTVFTS